MAKNKKLKFYIGLEVTNQEGNQQMFIRAFNRKQAQGYLSESSPEVMRVRFKKQNAGAALTIKGLANNLMEPKKTPHEKSVNLG